MNICSHSRVLYVGAKAGDCKAFSVPHLDIDHNGYAPNIPGIADGDYIDFRVCLDCGQILGFTSMSDEDIKIAFNYKDSE